MATYLKQSTAVDIGLGPFLDETDGKTAETGLTISQADVRLKKNNGNWAQKNDANAATHEENGWYEVVLNATDTNTLGILIVAVHEAGALPVWREFMVVPPKVYDSLVAGSDFLEVDTVQIEGADATDTIPTANANADALLDRTNGVETGLTPRQWLRLAAAVLFGKCSGLGTTNGVFRDVGDTKDRISATIDAVGNRTTVVRDAT